MKAVKQAVIGSLSLILFSFASEGGNKGTQPIYLETADQVRHAELLLTEVDSFRKKIDQCLVAGAAYPRSCHCLYPSRLSSLEMALQTTLEKYPRWESSALLWWGSKNRRPLNMHLSIVKVWINRPCSDLAMNRLR